MRLFNTYEELLRNLPVTEEPVVLPPFPMDTSDIETLDHVLTIIRFIEENHLDKINEKYHRLRVCKDSIIKLNNMIGLTEAKKDFAQQILSLCEGNRDGKINSVIYGPPGCGKTTLAQVLSDIYIKMGASSMGLIKGDRSNMIGEYVGQTAVKTKKLLQSALGGVLFIDEAYQLGHAADGNRCPFAYECINTINQFITENPGKLVIILAGYQKDIEQNFFSQNDGLSRRFPFKYNITGYTDTELFKIFKHQANPYVLADNAIDVAKFRDTSLFSFYGGDTENLFNCCRMFHDKRMFSQLKPDKILTKEDVDRGLELFRKHKDNKKEEQSDVWRHMYM